MYTYEVPVNVDIPYKSGYIIIFNVSWYYMVCDKL